MELHEVAEADRSTRRASGRASRTSATYRVEALAKGIRILDLFSDRVASLRLKEIADLAGIPMPTAFRLVSTLEQLDFLERLADGSLRPGPSIATLGFAALAASDLVAASTLQLERLARLVGETVNLGVLRHHEVLYVARLHGTSHLVTANVQVGSCLPAAVTSMGKLLLSFEQSAAASIEIGDLRGRWGPNAAADAAQFRRELDRIHTQGFAIQDEELASGLRSIAGPVRGVTGDVIGAVNVAVPAASFSVERLREEVLGPVLDCCDDVHADLVARSRRVGLRPGNARAGAAGIGDTATEPAEERAGTDTRPRRSVAPARAGLSA